MTKEPRLRFTKEERADPALKKPIRRAERAAAKADKAQAKLPKQPVKEKTVDPATGKVTTKLVLEDKKKPPSKLSHGMRDAPVNLVIGTVHREIRQSEKDNVGVESSHKSEEIAETGARLVQEGYRSHKLKPYRKAAQAERRLEKANVSALYQKSLRDNPQLASNPFSRWQQKHQIKKQYAAAKRASSFGTRATTASQSRIATRTFVDKAKQVGAFVVRHKRGFVIVLVLFLVVCFLLNSLSSCSMIAQNIGSAVAGSTYPSDDPELVAVEADYAAKETALQAEIDNIENNHSGYDEYRYDLDMIGHDPHELAAYLSAVLQGYTQASAQAELDRVFNAQYQLSLKEEVETRTVTETVTDPVTGETTTQQVERPWRVLCVTLETTPISSLAFQLLSQDQLDIYQVYRATLGNKPLVFGGGSPNTSDSESLTGVEFVNGTRPGNQTVVNIAKSQVGNVGGQPYWSWYGFPSRVEWCACFVSWCYGQVGLSEPRFAGCQSQGAAWFQSHGQWGARGYENIAPGDAIFFDWDLDGGADHVGIVIGTDGSKVYTVEGNSGDACKIRSYSLSYECIKGYGLMNW